MGRMFAPVFRGRAGHACLHRAVHPRNAMQRIAAVLLLAGMVLAAVSGLAPASALADADGAELDGSELEGSGAQVDVVEIDGFMNRTVTNHIVDRIEAAEAEGADLIVLGLDSEGTLGDRADDLVAAIEASAVPVVTWVGPPGARVAGAATVVAQASDALAVAPGTVIGPADPINLNDTGQELEDGALAGYAESHERDLDLVADLQDVGASVFVTEADALPDDVELPYDARPDQVRVVAPEDVAAEGIADLVAATLPDVLRDLDGREVALASGETTTLEVDTGTASLRFHSLSLVDQILHGVSTPTLAYLLIVAGAVCMLFEVFQPGFGIAGVTGFLMFVLGVVGLTALPVSWLAFAVVVISLIIFGVDLAVAGLGWLTALGTAGLIGGSWQLFTGPDLVRLSPWVIAAVVVFNLVFFVVIMTTVLRQQGNIAASGAEALVGKQAVVRSMLNPEGHVFVEGALWRARAPEDTGKITTGRVVQVVGLDDRLTLQVIPVEEDPHAK